MEFLVANWQVIVAGLLGLSEVLALIPSVKSNSIFQLVVNAIKSVGPGKKSGVVMAGEKGKLKK